VFEKKIIVVSILTMTIGNVVSSFPALVMEPKLSACLVLVQENTLGPSNDAKCLIF
jgi:hypothetical protein